MNPQYEINVHKGALRELENLPTERMKALKRQIRRIAQKDEPTNNAATKSLRGYEDLFRVRLGRYRIICELKKPTLRVLSVGKREYVYSSMDVIEQRQGES